MEQRFGFKDFVLVVLLVAILVSVWVAMVQFDRQHEAVARIGDRLAEQGDKLGELNDTLRQGVRVSGTGTVDGAGATAAVGDAVDPHYRVMLAKDQPDYATGDWYVEAFGSDVGKLTPVITNDAYQSRVESYVLEGLITRDPETLEWKPWIAERWEVSEDGLTIAFDLRKDVVFSDGSPLTSADVVFTLDLIKNPEINAPQLVSYYEVVESATAEGPHRVVFKLNEPYFLALSITGGTNILAKHWYERFSPEEFNGSTGYLFGSGPYRLPGDPEDWTPGSGGGQIELVRNENYWGPEPTFDRLVWRTISDPAAELVSFRNGEIDTYGVKPDQYEQLKSDGNLLSKADLYEYTSLGSGFRYVGWNQVRDGQPTPFADRRVRRAMTMLLNRQEMTEQLMAGLATVATGPFNPLSPQADPGVTPIAYDPEAAKALLKEAGYEDRNGDGVLEGPDGKRFEFTLVYPASRPDYQQMAQLLKDAYARAGITMNLDPTEFNTMLQKIDERQIDAITLGWGGTIESDPKQIFHSASITNGGSNYVSYANPEVDALIDKARVTVDEDERLAMWHEVHRLLQEDQPYTFLFNFKSVVFLDDRFKNVKVTRTGLNDVTEYYVPRGEQRWTP